MSRELLSVAEYQRFIEVGVLTPEVKVELLENRIVQKFPGNPPHDGTVGLVQDALRGVLLTGWCLRCRLSVELADSQPEPDFAITRGDERTYLTRHPVPADVGLVIEVADTSLLRDQRDKARIYARAGIVCYWIVNLDDRRAEVFTQPSGPSNAPAYASVVHHAAGDTVPLVLGGATVATVPVADLLP